MSDERSRSGEPTDGSRASDSADTPGERPGSMPPPEPLAYHPNRSTDDTARPSPGQGNDEPHDDAPTRAVPSGSPLASGYRGQSASGYPGQGAAGYSGRSGDRSAAPETALFDNPPPGWRAQPTPPNGVPAARVDPFPPYPPVVPSSAPVYVEAPKAPRLRGNRGFGLLITLVAAIAFVVFYGAAVAAIGVPRSRVAREFPGAYLEYVSTVPFWVPCAMFALAMALLVVIVNRGRWWGFVLGGFFVALLTYASFIAAVWLHGVLDRGGFLVVTVAEGWNLVGAALLSPYAIVAAILARELPIWFGAWIAWRGRSLTAENVERYAGYERELHGLGLSAHAGNIRP